MPMPRRARKRALFFCPSELVSEDRKMAAYTGLIKEKDLAKELGLTVWALRAWRKRGYGPPAGKVGRTVVYATSDVQKFLQSQIATGEGS